VCSCREQDLLVNLAFDLRTHKPIHLPTMATPRDSQALTKRNAETALMPPPPPPKRIKRPAIVLDEDTYTDGLSHIIARDFFPGVLETQTTQEYLNALDSNDPEWIAEAGRKVAHVMTPGPEGRRIRGRRGTSMRPTFGNGDETPQGWGGDTPMSVAASEASSALGSKEHEVDLNLSLAAFQAKYTSEDSESFNDLLDRENMKRREKHAWYWNGNKMPSKRQLAQEKVLASRGSTSSSTDLILAEMAKDKRPAMADFKQMGPRNPLMFKPDSIEDSHQTVAQAAEEKSLAPPKAINHSNTRIPVPELLHPEAPNSPTMSAVDAALSGRPRLTASEPGYTGSETPRVRGYAFVDAEPTPSEIAFANGQAIPDSLSLLSQLAPADSTPNPFRLEESSKREVLHQRLVEKSSKNKRAAGRVGELLSAETPGRTPTPKFLSAGGLKKKAGDLTPAAQSLFRKIGTPVRKGSAFDAKGEKKQDKVRWTPSLTPKIRR
jgi:protein DGCR14